MDQPQMLLAYLAERDEPCPRCGYNLRALTGQTCPECGSALRLRVGLVEARIGAFITLIAAAFAGFGGSLLFSLLALFYGGTRWWLDEGYPSSIFLVLLLLSSGAVIGLALPLRRMFMRRSDRMQWCIAVGLILYVVLMYAIILLTFND